MDAEEKAASMAEVLRSDFVPPGESLYTIEAIMIPLRVPVEAQMLLINFFIHADKLELRTLWPLTWPLVKKLKAAKHLELFDVVQTQIVSYQAEGELTERVVRLGVRVAAIDDVSLPSMESLLSDIDTKDYSILWYVDKIH